MKKLNLRKKGRERIADEQWKLYQEYKDTGCPKSKLLGMKLYSFREEDLFSLPDDEREKFIKTWQAEVGSWQTKCCLKLCFFIITAIIFLTIIYIGFVKR